LVEEFERLCGKLNLKTRKRSESERLRLETEPAVSISWTKRDDVIYFVHPVRGGERIFQLSFLPPGRKVCLDRGGVSPPAELSPTVTGITADPVIQCGRKLAQGSGWPEAQIGVS